MRYAPELFLCVGCGPRSENVGYWVFVGYWKVSANCFFKLVSEVKFRSSFLGSMHSDFVKTCWT